MKRSSSPQELKNTTPIKPLNRSHSKSTKSLSMSKSAETILIKKQAGKYEQVIAKMKKNRQRLCNTLDTYTLLIRSNNPIRCLQHNSNISVYCETEQKLLCSNCIFNKLEHKFHKVVPVDKIHDKLSRDIQIMQRQIQREVLGIQQSYRKISNHYQQEQKFANQFLKNLQKNYQNARILLNECQIESRKRIVQEIQKIQMKHETVLAELRFLKDVYKDQYIQIPPLKNFNFLIYEHAMCHTVVNQNKFSHQKWNFSVNEIQKCTSEQAKKIALLINMMQMQIKQKFKSK